MVKHTELGQTVVTKRTVMMTLMGKSLMGESLMGEQGEVAVIPDGL